MDVKSLIIKLLDYPLDSDVFLTRDDVGCMWSCNSINDDNLSTDKHITLTNLEREVNKMKEKWKIKLCSNGLYYLFEGIYIYRNTLGEYIEIDGKEDGDLICELLNNYEEQVQELTAYLEDTDS